MFDAVYLKFKAQIQARNYIITTHAEEEMEADALSVSEIEQVIQTGQIEERQEDRVTNEWKYRISGLTAENRLVEVVAKMSITGKMVIITVYSVS